jgi:hypothetical protein
MKCDKCNKTFGDFVGRGKTKEKVIIYHYKTAKGNLETRCQRHL